MASVQHVSLFTLPAFKSYVTGSNTGRIPLLAIACISLLANRLRVCMGCDWSRVVNLGALGGQLSELAEFWDMSDVVTAARRACCAFFYLGGRLTGDSSEYVERTRSHYLRALGKEESGDRESELKLGVHVMIFSAKTFSNCAGLLSMLRAFKVFNCSYISQTNLFGAAAGAVYFAHQIYVQEVSPTSKTEEKVEYLEQYKRKAYCDRINTVALLFGKVVGCIASFYVLRGGGSLVNLVVKHKSDLKLISFTAFMVTNLGSHLLSEQMKEFKKRNPISAG